MVQYSGKEFNAGDIVGALMWANVTGDVDAISNIKGKSVSSSIRNTYNSKGLLTKAVTTKSNAQSETVIFQYEYDSKGNWIKNIASYSGPKLNEFIIIFEREIVYYSNKEQQPTYTSLTAIEKSKLPDVDAEFPEGSLGIQKYLTANAKYPMEAMENGVMGDVKVSFTINEDGSISDPQITKTVSQALDKEVIRVINSMPKWKPAIKDEKQIKTKKELKIRFRLLGFGEYSITLLK